MANTKKSTSKTSKNKTGIGIVRSKTTLNETPASDYLFSSKNTKIINSYKNKVNGVQNWWEINDLDKIHESIATAISTIEATQTKRRLQMINFARAYGNYESIGLPFNTGARYGSNSMNNISPNRVTVNVVQQVVDTAASKIAKDRPKVTFVTSGEKDYKLRIQAQMMTKYIAGLFKQSKVYENSELVFRDGAVAGTGYIGVFEEDNQIKTEWISSIQVLVDELDGHEQKPRSMHRWRLIARDQLMHLYPEKAKQIASCDPYLTGYMTVKSTVDVIKVVESWHLPTQPGAKDGIHAIVIENATLFVDPAYNDDYFPIVVWRWYPNFLGFFGRSITEEILPIQRRIDDLLSDIQQAQRLVARPLVWVPREANIPKDVIGGNGIGRIIHYAGAQPPTFQTPVAMNAEVYEHLNWLVQQAFQVVGVSQASASGQKPAGVESAVAMREVQDIESGRFAVVALRWEQWFVDLARIMLDRSKQLFLDNKDLTMTVMEKKIIREIKWKDVDITDQPFDLITFPTSQLPDTPAGRMQTITEMRDNNFISNDMAAELLNIDPDLENAVNFQTASLRRVEQAISAMVETGEYIMPDPYLNLQQAQSVANGIYNQLVTDKCPEDRLQLVRDYMTAIVDFLSPPAPPPQQQMPQGSPGPEQMPLTGAPMLPPQPEPQAPVAQAPINVPLSR